jgi:predicted 3-demethylubiquinone-9 3-methyltransferase (glyoxalase superfamily)
VPKITPFLWFDNNIQEALDFYASVFPDFELRDISRAGDDGPVFSATFRVANLDLYALNGGPQYTFNEAISFFIECADQDEVDTYWNKLVEGGSPIQCGWLKDRFGLVWQVIPSQMSELLQGGGDPERANRVMQAMMQMQKIDLGQLQAAYDAA